MKSVLVALGAAAFAFGAAPSSAATAEEKGAARFAELTQGRTAGEPRSCISAMRSNDLKVVEYLGIVYEQGDTVWIARAADPRSLGHSDVPIFERFGSQLCRQDVIRTIDRSSHFTTGVVFLDEFVPYTKQG